MLWPALPDDAGSQVLALLGQLQHLQWLDHDELRARQLSQLQQLVPHAVTTVPFYRERLRGLCDAGAAPGWDAFRRFPLLTRRDLQDHYTALASTAPVAAHGATGEASTSGSTGTPVRVLRTDLDRLFWKAHTLLDHAWHQRDMNGRLAAIRQGPAEEAGDNWGAATAGLLWTGAASTFPVGRPVSEQAAWLMRQQPDYLLSHPSNLAALAEYCMDHGIRPDRLREARSSGESLSPEVRAQCSAAWNVPVTDMYSSNEVGYIALQCPDTGQYHAMCGDLLVEILDGDGQPCAPGQIGRVVLTTLHNFAMPLIRYEIGDYAEAGGACACGRGFTTLRRILGRVRNMLVLAGGERWWPSFGLRGPARELGIRQHQIVQKDFGLIEVRLVSDRPLDAAGERRLRELLLSKLPPGFRVEVLRCPEIARSASGKFEDFVSELAAARP